MTLSRVRATEPLWRAALETLTAPPPCLEADLLTLAGDLDAAACRFLLLLGELDRREAWPGEVVRSCAHCVAWRRGPDLVTARERVRIARALPDLPQPTAAFAVREVSYAKVRAVTRVATPATEEECLELCRSGTASRVEAVVPLPRKRALAPAGSVTRTLPRKRRWCPRDRWRGRFRGSARAAVAARAAGSAA